MDSNSQKTLRRIEQNADQLTTLRIGSAFLHGGFISSDTSDYLRLGTAIGNNTHLTKLIVAPDDEDPLNATNNEFFNGLKRNSSISDLGLRCNQHNLVGGVEHEILKSYQKINNNLTGLCINEAVLDNGGCNVITETLRWCRNIKTINLGDNSITDDQLLPIVEAIRGKRMLEKLLLYGNRIGNIGCQAIATLLGDPNTKLQDLRLFDNNINNEGATAIADSLANNTKLKWLYLDENPFEPSVVGIFGRALCNISSVNTTYRSNHTLKYLLLSNNEQQWQHADHLVTLLNLNEETNKSHVATKKILKYHPNIDMGPLFEWDADGEQTLKALPHVINWFRRAEEAVSGDDEGDYNIEERKLSAIFQFAKAMPLFFVPACQIKVNDNKRKRDDT